MDVFYSRQGKTSTRNAPGAVDKENSSKAISAIVTKGSFSVSETVYPCDIFRTVAADVLKFREKLNIPYEKSKMEERTV